MIRTVFCIFIAAAAHPMMAQDSAKALFLDTADGRAVVTKGAAGGAAGSHKIAAVKQLPVAHGVKYWIELEKADGDILRVSADHSFHSGDRIRLHLASNVKGKLVIMQKEDNGQFGLLFPKSAAADNTVMSLQEQAIPSDTRWFRFDNNPGQLTLMVMVTPEGGALKQDMGNVGRTADGMLKKSAELSGSKALVEETPEEEDRASYVVLNPVKRELADGPLAFEISIRHLP